MNIGIFLLFLATILSIIFIIVSTKGDVKQYRNKKTTQKVATQISQRMCDKTLRMMFLKQNVWEMTFFWCGVLFGIIIGVLL